MRKTLRRRSRSRGGSTRKKSLFPYAKGVAYDKLMMTPEGEYSITTRDDGKVLLKHMKSVLGDLSKKTITDLTGNVGGDTILFGLHFKEVHSIEIDSDNFAALQNNVETFGLKNVKLYHGDSTKLFNWKSDVVYVDAPWGGPDYKNKSNLDLFLGDTRVDVFVKDILARENRPEYVFLKVPRNYNFDRLSEFEFTEKFRIRGFYVVAVK